MKTVNLCSSCEKCPVVEIDKTEIRIGEKGNMVKLKPKEWKALKSKIKRGDL